jgi:hypothetical protein
LASGRRSLEGKRARRRPTQIPKGGLTFRNKEKEAVCLGFKEEDLHEFK